MQNLARSIANRSVTIFSKILLPVWLLPLIFIPSTGSTETYEWVQMGKSDLRVITDFQVEANFRLDLLDSAESTIDLVTFDQRMDPEIGLPLLDKLAKAAARGIKIRYAISGSMTPVTDPFNQVGSYLNRVATQFPNLKYLFAGGLAMMWKSGWSALDGIHEKLLIIDRKIAFVTGRGHSISYANWLDTAFVFKGTLVEQSHVAFEKLWHTLNRELALQVDVRIEEDNASSPVLSNSRKAIAAGAEISIPPVNTSLKFTISDAAQIEISSLNEWRKQPASNQTQYRARLLHHDFLDQIRAVGRKPRDISPLERLKILSDPIVEAVKSKLPDAKSLEICQLATILNPEFKTILLEALHRSPPLRLSLFTNNKQNHARITKLGMASGWYAGLNDLDDLLQTGNVNATVLQDDRPEASEPSLTWLHRKLILINAGEKSSVIFGSHNLTHASSVVLDEMSFEIESADFYHEMLQLFNTDLDRYGKDLDPAAIHHKRESSAWGTWMAKSFALMYSPIEAKKPL